MVIVTPLAYDEFRASGEGYQAMIDASAAQRTGTSDEIAEAAAFLLGEHARFITGTDLLIDGGVVASIRTGEFKLWQQFFSSGWSFLISLQLMRSFSGDLTSHTWKFISHLKDSA